MTTKSQHQQQHTAVIAHSVNTPQHTKKTRQIAAPKSVSPTSRREKGKNKDRITFPAVTCVDMNDSIDYRNYRFQQLDPYEVSNYSIGSMHLNSHVNTTSHSYFNNGW